MSGIFIFQSVSTTKLEITICKGNPVTHGSLQTITQCAVGNIHQVRENISISNRENTYNSKLLPCAHL